MLIEMQAQIIIPILAILIWASEFVLATSEASRENFHQLSKLSKFRPENPSNRQKYLTESESQSATAYEHTTKQLANRVEPNNNQRIRTSLPTNNRLNGRTALRFAHSAHNSRDPITKSNLTNEDTQLDTKHNYDMQASELVSPFFISSDGSIANINGSPYYNQASNSLQPTNQEQSLSSFYVSDMSGNQQIWPPPVGASANQFAIMGAYAGPLNNGQPSQHPNYAQSFVQPINAIRPMQAHRALRNQPNYSGSEKKASRIQAEFSDSAPKSAKNMLSNEQLMSLIAELKDHNSRAARFRPRNTQAPSSRPQPTSRSNDDRRKSGTKSRVSSSRKVPQNSRSEAEKSEDLSPEQLEKFAKFLASKEGANLKFQLGLDKDAPDDGDRDEDDKDSLMESTKSKTTSQASDSQQEPEDGDEQAGKQTKVASEIDKLIDILTRTTDKVDRLKDQDIDSDKENSGDDEPDSSRKRRYDKQSTEGRQFSRKGASIEVGRRSMNNDIKPEGGDNFAKMLIKQELLEDKLESKNTPTQSSQEYSNNERDRNNDAISRKKNSSQSNILKELEHLRKKKLDLTAGFKNAPVDGDVRDALVGKLQVKSERYPDGKLVVSSNQKPAVSLHPINNQSLTNFDSVDRTNSELVPRQVEPDSGDNNGNLGNRATNSDYQISSHMGNQLNALSNSLDKYFNDGFMKQIDDKSAYNGAPPKDRYHPASTDQSRQKSRNTSNAGNQVDPDFDINVGIDGKRETEDQTGESEDDGDDERVRAVGRKRQLTRARTVKPKRRANSPGRPRKRAVNISRHKNGGESERVEYSNETKPIDRTDPVENEQLETPIGPDKNNPISMDDTSMIKGRKKVVRKTDSRSSISGRRLPGSFYREPEWQS